MKMKLWMIECKRCLKIKTTIVYFLIIIVLAILFGYYCIFVSGADVIGSDGALSISKGKDAIKDKMSYDKVTEGLINEAKLEDALQIIKESYDKEKDELIYSNNLLYHEPIWGVISNLLYVNMENNEFNYNSFMEIPDAVASDFYSLRQEKLERMFKKQYQSDKLIHKAVEISNGVTTPFSFYRGYEFWNTAIEYLSLLIFVILMMGILFAAPMFAESYNNGADDIFRTTKYGRHHIGAVKVFVALLYGAVLYIVGVGVFLGIIVSYLGVDGLKSSFQMMNIYSIAPLTYKGALTCILVSGMISILSTVAFTIFLSAKSNSTSEVITLSMAFVLIYKVLLLLIKTGHVMNFILSISPFSGTDIIYSLHTGKIYLIFGMTVWECGLRI